MLVFPQLFFPTGNPTTALIASFGVFGAAMIARPIGAIVFGHLGDKRGRKTTLVLSLLTMGIATFLIGCLPTFSQAGLLAPILLLVLRLTQGFALGGEWSGAALVATENAPAGKRAWYGTFPQVGAPLGFIIANGIFLSINFGAAAPGRRRPAVRGVPDLGLAGAVPVLGGDGDRRAVGAAEAGRVGGVHRGREARRDPQAAARRHLPAPLEGGHPGTFIMLATYVLFYLMTSFTLTYGTAKTDATPAGLGFSYTTFVLMQIIGVVFFGIFTLLSGPLADSIGRRKLLLGRRRPSSRSG